MAPPAQQQQMSVDPPLPNSGGTNDMKHAMEATHGSIVRSLPWKSNNRLRSPVAHSLYRKADAGTPGWNSVR